MITSKIVIIYIFALSVQGFLSSRKKSFWGLLLPIISAVSFLADFGEIYYNVLIWQMVIFGIARSVITIAAAIKYRKTSRKTDKIKIKDL